MNRKPRRGVVALSWSIEALVRKGGAWAYVFTYWSVVEPPKILHKSWEGVLGRLRRNGGINGVRVFQFGRKKGRKHVHAVFDRRVSREEFHRARRGSLIGWVKHEREATEGAVEYLIGDYVKHYARSERASTERLRQWATIGDFEGRERECDIVIRNPLGECVAAAFSMRERGQSVESVMGAAMKEYRLQNVRKRLEREQMEGGDKDERESIQWESRQAEGRGVGCGVGSAVPGNGVEEDGQNSGLGF